MFDRKLRISKNLPKWTIFVIFDELLSTQIVNVARFARNVEWDFFCDFPTACHLFSLLKEWVIFEVTIGKVDSVISLKQI